MTISNLLAPIPRWVLINNEGTVAGGAKLYTYSSINKILPKTVYQDAGFNKPWTNPIIFDLNGIQGPFYWTVNSGNLNDTYYLEAYDADGNLLWTQDNYFPPGAGGGGNTNTFLPLVNYIANNQFIDHIGDTASPVASKNLVIAPSSHKGFTPALINPVEGTYGVVGPDIRFVKSNIDATDQITFELFPLASAPLGVAGTPVDFVRYVSNGVPEDYKAFQFPITQKVKNLSNQRMTFIFWAKYTTTPATLPLFVRQYFGSAPTASAEVRTPVASYVLSDTWTQYSTFFTVPDVTGKNIGNINFQTDDDAIYIQLGMPTNAGCDVSFTKPALYLGEVLTTATFENYDQINSINSTPRTSDTKTTYVSDPTATLTKPALNGWVPMNDGSIGNVGSAATTRANKDTFQLYKTLWDGVSNTYAPVSTGRGATAIADFIANKTLTLTRSLGRAMAGAGAGAGLTARALGEYVGEETHQLTSSEMPDRVPVANSSAISTQSVATGINTDVPGGLLVWTPGGNLAHNNMQPTSFMNVFIKL